MINMKQKRKTKSLIPMHFNWNYWLLTSMLLVLWWVFCFLALSLQAISVDALWVTNWLLFSWYDDKTEVIYHMYYVQEIDQSDTWVVDEMYMNQTWDDSNFYIVPGRVLVGPLNSWGYVEHTLWDDNYVNILWWDNIVVYSDDISVVAWDSNAVYKWNNSSTSLWWRGNIIWTGDWSGLPANLLWWVGNSIDNNQDWNMIIWWLNNEISDSVSNSSILWGENNKVSSDWAIVAWTEVNLGNWVDNVFVFSNSLEQFSPKSHNAFYLNVWSWVWLNEDPFNRGVTSNWSISFWDIDINEQCNPSNFWVQWSWSWCLVWCTFWSYSDWKRWDLLDQSERCRGICFNADKCKNPTTWDNQKSSWYCSRELNKPREALCPGLNAAEWTNVVFNVVLVDNRACSWNGNINQCIYQCADGYHLFEDWKCYKDCDLPWGWTIKHGETVKWYRKSNVTCWPTSCESNWQWKEMICVDWKLEGSWTYVFEKCKTYGNHSCKSKWYTFSTKITNADCIGPCIDYKVNGNACEWDGSYYSCTCVAGYEFNKAHTACVEQSIDDFCWSDNWKTLLNEPTSLCDWEGVVASNPIKDEINGVRNWTCTKWDNPQPCSANILVPTPPEWDDEFECTWPVPAHAKFVTWSDEWLTGNVIRKVYSDDVASYMKCAYKCDNINGYVYDESTQSCKGDNGGGYQCVWTEPAHAKFVTWSDEWLTWNVTRMVYSNDEVSWKKCAYLCEPGYVAYNGVCYPCEAWTRSASNPDYCILEVDCGTWYLWNNDYWKCQRVWSCKLSDWKLHNFLPDNSMQVWSDVVPIWTSDQYLECYDDWASVTSNSCKFSCNKGYYCTPYDGLNLPKCRQPYCLYNWHGDSRYYIYWWTPLKSQVNQYMWLDATFVDVGTEAEFRSYVANNPNWCWFWCPEENRYEYSYGIYCYSAEQVEHLKEEEQNKKYKCANEYHYWYEYESTWTPTYEWQPWHYYENENEYHAARDRWEACIWTCYDDAIMRQWYIRSEGDLSTSSNTFTCWKPCKKDESWNFVEYATQRCNTCPRGTMPNPDTSTWVWGQPSSCVEIKCPDWFGLLSDWQTCGANNMNWKCPSGVNGKIINGVCVICLDPNKHITDDWECVDN